jgi:ubiquinone biosynthesis protein
MPRPERLAPPDLEGAAAPAMARDLTFRAGLLRVLARMLLWGVALLRFVVPSAVDFVLRRGSIHRRATRVRRILHSMGPTFHKVGQQLSVRADILPYAYCQELAKLLDDAPPMRLEQAIAAVERSTGRPLDETFSTFDPEPIGSASVACVYQATLRDGRDVAVKVRRPGIGPTLVADLKVIAILASLSEFFTVAREGTTKNLRQELGSMLLEELDFEHEARNVELFRRSAKKAKLKWLSAPAVHLGISSDEVLVTDLVRAVPLTGVLAAVDQQDDGALQRLAELGIDPKKVARRLMRTWNFEVFHFTLFHADPHPANIFVGPGSTLIFIDFGSCGRVATRVRELTRRINHFLDDKDAAGGADTAVKMLEPLPPIDVDAFTKELEQLYWSYIRANASKRSEWWEKSSGRLWMRFAGLARKWGLPVNLDTLRLFRATFLFDTIVIRLYPSIDMTREFRGFCKKEAPLRRKELRRRMKQAGLDPRSGAHNAAEMLRIGTRAARKLDDAVSVPNASFALLPGKVAQIMVTLIWAVAGLAVGVTIIAGIYDMILEGDLNPDPHLGMFGQVLSHPVAAVVLVAVIVLVFRKVKMRLDRVKL